MTETQETINQWQLDTFGERMYKPNELAIRTNTEMAELLTAVASNGSRKQISMECADVVIMVMGLCSSLSISLQEAVDYKMAVNRERKWDIPETGHVQHKEAT